MAPATWELVRPKCVLELAHVVGEVRESVHVGVGIAGRPAKRIGRYDSVVSAKRLDRWPPIVGAAGNRDAVDEEEGMP